MRILYTNSAPDIDDPAIPKIETMGHEVIQYDKIINPRVKYLMEIRHFQMYEDILNMAERLKVDIIYFVSQISCPEIFLSEMKLKPNYRPKIMANGSFREMNRSLARAMTLAELVNMKQFARMLIVSYFVEDKIFPENFVKANFDMSKIVLRNEGFGIGDDLDSYNISKLEARKEFGIKENEFVCLLSGSWKYSKGVDIVVDALRYIPSNISIIIHRHHWNFAEDPTLPNNLDDEISKYSNVRIIEERMDNQKFAKLCLATDALIASHRKLYEYSFTGIPTTSGLCKRPMIAPDFFPFSEVIKRFKVGTTYEPENPESLARSIIFMRNNYATIMAKAKFIESLGNHKDDTCFQPDVIKHYTDNLK